MRYYIDVDNEFEKSENRNAEEYLKSKNILGVDLKIDTNDISRILENIL